MTQHVPMTPEGYRKLRDELKRLKSVERPKIVEQIEVARAHGDLSENAEYDDAKERQQHLNRRIQEIEDKLSRAKVIDPSQMNHNKIFFGATVLLQDVESDEEKKYRIVGAEESDISQGKISIESPLARAMIGKEVGDLVKVTAPGGLREFEILEISYQ